MRNNFFPVFDLLSSDARPPFEIFSLGLCKTIGTAPELCERAVLIGSRPLLIGTALEARARCRVLQVGTTPELCLVARVAEKHALGTNETSLLLWSLGPGPAVGAAAPLPCLAAFVLVAFAGLAVAAGRRFAVVATAEQGVLAPGGRAAFEFAPGRHSGAIAATAELGVLAGAKLGAALVERTRRGKKAVRTTAVGGVAAGLHRCRLAAPRKDGQINLFAAGSLAGTLLLSFSRTSGGGHKSLFLRRRGSSRTVAAAKDPPVVIVLALLLRCCRIRRPLSQAGSLAAWRLVAVVFLHEFLVLGALVGRHRLARLDAEDLAGFLAAAALLGAGAPAAGVPGTRADFRAVARLGRVVAQLSLKGCNFEKGFFLHPDN
jgi:hypothetical protein